MKRFLWVLSLAFCISIIFCLSALAKKRKTPRLNEDVALPAEQTEHSFRDAGCLAFLAGCKIAQRNACVPNAAAARV
jgi:hypothetical protein